MRWRIKIAKYLVESNNFYKLIKLENERDF
jgi:hypothetical protein